MQVKKILVLVALLGTTACTQIVTNSTRKEAIAQCESMGKEFFELERINKGGMFGSVTLSGKCLGPDDEEYAEAVAERDAATNP